MYNDGGRSEFPHKGLAIIQSPSLNENRELHESHRNKDVVWTVTMCDDLLALQS